MLNQRMLDKIICNALEEDVFRGDLTSEMTIPEENMSRAIIKVKAPGIICGLEVVKRVFEIVDPSIVFIQVIEEGGQVEVGDIAAKLEGNTKSLLTGERTALNFLQRMSGIATLTRLFCDKTKGTKARIVDTRKTAPGLRLLDKYAVVCGGGTNHRYCLADGILIKDNHIKAAGGIKDALKAVKGKVPHTLKIEIETSTLSEVREAIEEGADIIMLDNMTVDEMKEAVRLINGKAIVEASGNVSIENVNQIAFAGVDVISIGALTHSVEAMDISMKIE